MPKIRQLVSLEPCDMHALHQAAAVEGLSPTVMARMLILRGLRGYRAAGPNMAPTGHPEPESVR